MDLEKEMEMYGAFQGNSARNKSNARLTGENIDALVIPTRPCECIYGNQSEQRQYRIPEATEYPTLNRGILRKWIKDFHEMNHIPLPKGFYQRDKRQLQGMFYGMCKNPKYGISTDKILKSQD